MAKVITVSATSEGGLEVKLFKAGERRLAEAAAVLHAIEKHAQGDVVEKAKSAATEIKEIIATLADDASDDDSEEPDA